MTTKDKMVLLQDKHFAAWANTRKQVFEELSGKQLTICMCGKLATGLHEQNCRTINNAVDKETVKRLSHLI